MEGERHKAIRKMVADVIDERIESTGCKQELLQSHEKGKGKLNLYFSLNDRILKNEWMADVDLAIVDPRVPSSVHTIIEIKTKDIRPKDIAGIIGAIAISTKLKNQDKVYKIDRTRLIIVVDSLELIKGIKDKQLSRLQSFLKIEGGSTCSVDICNEENFKKIDFKL